MRKNKVGKGRERKKEFGLAFSHTSGRKLGGVIITKFCTRVHVCYVMILAIFGVDISRGVDSVDCKGLKFRVSHLLGVLALQLQH